MKKFVVFANCQGAALTRTLMENREFAASYVRLWTESAHELSMSNAADTIAQVEQADLLLHQPVRQTAERPLELSSDYLKSRLPSHARCLSFPSLYFDGYFPHMASFQGNVSVLSRVHDYFIAYCFCMGKSVDETVALIENETLYSPRLSKRLLKSALNNLKAREKKDKIDIRISRFIRDNFRQVKLFNQFNHPTRIVLVHIAEQILKSLGISDWGIPREGKGYLDKVSVPVYRSTYRNLRLEFDEAFSEYTSNLHGALSTLEVVNAFFEHYSTYDPREMRAHLVEAKPFIPSLVKTSG